MKTAPGGKMIEILLVEDSDTDALFAGEAFAESGMIHRLHVVEDGVKAIAFLRREAPYAAAPRPHLILLDLNLPRRNGFEVLAEIKANEDLRVIPLIVLTTSIADGDVLKSYQLHANAYLTKPSGLASYAETAAAIERFWFASVASPHRPNVL